MTRMVSAAEASRGVHLLADLDGCQPALLDDARVLEQSLRQAAAISGLNVVGAAVHSFTPQGVTAVLLLAESHMCIHTWPDTGFAAVDLFSCRADNDLYSALGFLARSVRASKMRVTECKRGDLRADEAVVAHELLPPFAVSSGA